MAIRVLAGPGSGKTTVITHRYAHLIGYGLRYARRMQQAAAMTDEHDRVVISTIHKLKGKERPIVFGIRWSEGWTEEGEPIGLLPHTLCLRSDAPEALEDEQCVAFVLISRAKEACYVSGVREYMEMDDTDLALGANGATLSCTGSLLQ